MLPKYILGQNLVTLKPKHNQMTFPVHKIRLCMVYSYINSQQLSNKLINLTQSVSFIFHRFSLCLFLILIHTKHVLRIRLNLFKMISPGFVGLIINAVFLLFG
jgi:hypothetical protein